MRQSHTSSWASAISRSSRCEVLAISDVPQVNPQAELTALAASAAQECVAHGGHGLWPPLDNANRHALFAHRQLAQVLGNAAILSLPLLDAQEKTRGFCLLVGEHQRLAAAELQSLLHAASTPLGSALGLIQRARGNRFDRLAVSLGTLVRAHTTKIALWIVALTVCAMLLPSPTSRL